MPNHAESKYFHLIKEILFIGGGVTSACFGLKSFLMPNGFIDGGVTGISLLVTTLTSFKLHYLIVLINIPFVILGYHQIGKSFAIKTTAAIVLLSIMLVVAPFEHHTR